MLIRIIITTVMSVSDITSMCVAECIAMCVPARVIAVVVGCVAAESGKKHDFLHRSFVRLVLECDAVCGNVLQCVRVCCFSVL